MDNGAQRAEELLPPWLDKPFIQKALQTGYEDSTIYVTSCEVTSAYTVGVGHLSDMYRIVAEIRGSHEHHMLIKCHPLGGQREELVRNLGAFLKETQMMSETIPEMYKLLQDARPGRYRPFSAKCLYHGDSPVTYVIMEDLRHQGFKLVDRTRGMDLSHATLAIKTLAQFHASSVALHDREPAAVECYKSPISQETKDSAGMFFGNAIRCLTNEVSKWSGYEIYSSKLNKLQNTVFDRLLKVHDIDRDELNVLNHGDMWTTNMMFKYSGDTLEDIRFVDFQISHFGSPGFDLQYFLFTCLSDEVRIEYFDHLIEEYHSTLTETLNILGCSEHVVSLTQLQKAIKRRAFHGFIAAASIMPIALTNPENGFDVEGSLSENGESDISNAKLYSNKTYVNVMKRLLPLFDKEGLLD